MEETKEGGSERERSREMKKRREKDGEKREIIKMGRRKK